MKTRLLSTIAFLSLAALLPSSASADLLVWELMAECRPSAKSVKLSMTHSVDEWSTIKSPEKLYACGGGSCKSEALATPITWNTVGTSCTCMPSGKSKENEGCDEDDFYTKCVQYDEAVLPYSCDELAYDRICVQASCEDGGWSSYGDGAPCATLSPPAGAKQCLTAVEPIETIAKVIDPKKTVTTTPAKDTVAEEGGCSISGEAAANASLLALLLLVGGLALLRSRRSAR
jgi:hypothetical protein